MQVSKMMLGVAAVAVLSAGAAQAAGVSNAAPKAGPASPMAVAVEQAHLAGELAAYGRKANSPMALVLAAELTAATAGPEAKRAKTATPGQASAAGKTDKPADTVISLLAEARAMAGPDTSLQPAIQRVAAQENKGRVNGPSRTYERVLAGSTDSFQTRFVGGERATVLVDGDGDTDLDLYVYDQNGNQICSDTDDTDTMLCQWTPAWTGTFTIKVKNYGRVYNNYVLLTN